MDLTLYILTYNCGRSFIQPDIFAPFLFSALPSTTPDILVVCLQEVAPIANSFLGGSFLTPYLNAFRQAVKLAAADQKYVNVIARNVGMTAIMIFARQDLAPNIVWTLTAGVGVGLYEMGNKGAVGVRLGYRTGNNLMELTFVAAHLAPTEQDMERRNEDYKNIVQRLVFVSEDTKKLPSQDERGEDAPLLQGLPKGDDMPSSMYSSSHLFFAGDLNYRTSLLQPSPDDAKDFPRPRKGDNAFQHFKNLLKDDQLSQQMKQGKTLQKLHEAAITFPPTYKYDQDQRKAVTLDEEQEWKWASHRWPSWCDRILWFGGEVKTIKYTALPLFSTSDHRPVALAVKIPLTATPSTEVSREPPFKQDAGWRAKRTAARRKEIVVGLMSYVVLTREGNVLLIATIVGAIGGWLMIKALSTP